MKKKYYIIPVVLTTVVVGVVYLASLNHYCNSWNTKLLYCSRLDGFSGFYGKNLRGSLFSGFIALGGFLLSLKAFIVVTMKREVYDNPVYIEHWIEESPKKNRGERYDTLRDLSSVLFLSILTCVSAAILQITVGLIEELFAAVVCLWAAALAASYLIFCLFLINTNLGAMFEYLRKDGESGTGEGVSGGSDAGEGGDKHSPTK